MQFEAEVQRERLLTAKKPRSKFLPRTSRAIYYQLHHRHQAGPDHPEIGSSGPAMPRIVIDSVMVKELVGLGEELKVENYATEVL